jgi:hypothetical protein
MSEINTDYSDKRIIDQFLGRYGNENSMVRYKTTVNDFIDTLSYKKIEDINKNELLDYMDLIKDNAARVTHFREFLKFLISEGLLRTLILNDGSFIEKVYNYKAVHKNSDRNAIMYSINTILQMDRDIKTNYKNISINDGKRIYERMKKIALIWELIFDAGCTVGDIKKLRSIYFLDKNEYLKSGKTNDIVEKYYNSEINSIKNIINDYYKFLETLSIKKSRDGFNSLECLEYYCNDELLIYDGLLPQDIIAARNKFYITCPNCGTESRTLSSNWIFIKHKDVEDKFLVCKKCKGNDLHDE